MPSGITFGGLASGLDTQAIVSALLAVESRPLQLLEAKRSGFQESAKLFGTLLANLKTLEDKLDVLSKPEEFLAYDATLSEEGFFTATTSGEAAPGAYEIEVTKLARSSLDRSAGYADADVTTTGNGTLSITVDGVQTDITLDATNDTLFGVKDAINASDAEVTASVVFDGTDYHLELRGKKTGVANDVSVDTTGITGGDQTLALTTVRDGEDAAFTVDGLNFTHGDNNVENSVPGITLALTATTDPLFPVTMTVSENPEAIEDQVNDFISAYNSVVSFINTQSRYNPDADQGAPPLFGDISLRMLRQDLASTISSQVAGDFGVYDSLASIGIRSANDGTLSLDSDDFREAMSEDLTNVSDLFTDSTTGIAAQLTESLEIRTRVGDGLIEMRTDSIQESIRRLDDKLRAGEERLGRLEVNLIRKFAAFETLISQLQAQGGQLNSFGFQAS